MHSRAKSGIWSARTALRLYTSSRDGGDDSSSSKAVALPDDRICRFDRMVQRAEIRGVGGIKSVTLPASVVSAVIMSAPFNNSNSKRQLP